MQRRFTLKALTAAVALASISAVPAFAADTIKVGVLHSLSGTMAISETVLKDTVLMAIDDINAKGGVLGKKLEPVVVDPASNWPLFAEKTKQLLGQDKVSVIWRGWPAGALAVAAGAALPPSGLVAVVSLGAGSAAQAAAARLAPAISRAKRFEAWTAGWRVFAWRMGSDPR